MDTNRPFLVIPKFIVQPTWGGNYIVNFKNWQSRPNLSDLKIGQSYELAGDSLLATSCLNSAAADFQPFIIDPVKTDTVKLSLLIKENPVEILGKKIANQFDKMPILIKFTQALGNSFQLHVKAKTPDAPWKPKPESWYFLEDGFVTLGVKSTTKVGDYRKACIAIDNKMREIEGLVKQKKINLNDAKKQAAQFINKINPWQFVNQLRINRNNLVDLSGGGIHHSWEENPSLPLGNIVYEVQVDVSDEDATLRSFDQGKIKADGSIRKLTIEDYFKNLDSDNYHNDIKSLVQEPNGNHIFSTKFYSMDILELVKPYKASLRESFEHLFILNGNAELKTKDLTLHLHQGHSAFIPWKLREYDIIPTSDKVTILKTFMDI
jgi:mannose-6-phosphate isomerase class I